jgi:hypothetical protein
MAFATLPAGWVLTRRRDEWRRYATPRRLLAAGLGALVFLTLVWSNDLSNLRRRWERTADLPRVSRSVAPSGTSSHATNRRDETGASEDTTLARALCVSQTATMVCAPAASTQVICKLASSDESYAGLHARFLSAPKSEI